MAGKLALQRSRSSGRRSAKMGGDLYGPVSPANSIDDEFYPEDYEVFGTTVNVRRAAGHTQSVWVDPEILKPLHRIGRGPFGDSWLATVHNSTADFDEYHEVAVKMLPVDSEEQVRSLLQKFESQFQITEGMRGVSWPQGISIKNGRACIITKYYEGSVGDKMARLPSNKLPLGDVLRYSQDLLRGVLELHAHGILALNLKPCNFLLDHQDVAIVGEFGIPMLFAGTASLSEQAVWLGSPNYMAPEQWGANVRGPVSLETDCWSFACSVLEMFTGERPWGNMTPEEIFKAVVIRHDKPIVPSELPPAVERVLNGCFEYDYRHRPAFHEILRAFIYPEEPFKVGDWISVREKPNDQCTRIGVVKSVLGPDSVLVQFCDKAGEPIHCSGASRLHLWSLWKDPFQVGDTVRLKSSVETPRFGWPGEVQESEGKVSEIGVQDGVILVTFRGSLEAWRADPVQLERVSGGLVVGDWVRLRSGWSTDANSGQMPSRVGVVHQVDHSGKLKVAFFGRETLWTGNPAECEKNPSFCNGQYVRLKQEVIAPRFDWPLKESGGWDTGRITNVLPNGGLMVNFPGRFFNRKGGWADPEETEVIRINEISGVINKYQHLEKMHWAVRPALSLIGFLIAARTGVVILNLVTRPLRGKKQPTSDNEAGVKVDENQANNAQHLNGFGKELSAPGNPVWLPSQVAAATSTVASLIFGDGVTAPIR